MVGGAICFIWPSQMTSLFYRSSCLSIYTRTSCTGTSCTHVTRTARTCATKRSAKCRYAYVSYMYGSTSPARQISRVTIEMWRQWEGWTVLISSRRLVHLKNRPEDVCQRFFPEFLSMSHFCMFTHLICTRYFKWEWILPKQFVSALHFNLRPIGTPIPPT